MLLAATGRDAREVTAGEFRAAGGRAVACVTDVAEASAVTRRMDATLAEFVRLDIRVNNSGISGPTAPVVEFWRGEWDRTLAVSDTRAFLCAKHALPCRITRGSGGVIDITSVAGLIGYALRSPYAVSTWGMIARTRSLAREVGIHGVTVSAIAPGAVRGARMDSVIRDRAAPGVGRGRQHPGRDDQREREVPALIGQSRSRHVVRCAGRERGPWCACRFTAAHHVPPHSTARANLQRTTTSFESTSWPSARSRAK